MTLLVALHVAAAVFLIGPLTFASSVSPRAVRQGADGLGALRLLYRTTRLYTLLSLVVALLGLALVHYPGNGFNRFWVAGSVTLFVVAVGVLLLVVVRDQHSAIARIEKGEEAADLAARIRAGAAIAALCWLAIVFLMVFRPGG